MADLPTYQFPMRPDDGVLLGLSPARLVAIGLAGVVLIVTMLAPTLAGLIVGAVAIVTLLGLAAVRIGGRVAIEWLPVAAGYGWATLTGNRSFHRCDDLALDLPEQALDLPGELFGIELHDLAIDATAATVANPTPARYGIVRDTFRNRLVTVAEISGADFLFCDPDVQQARIAAWGGLLDHVAQAMPEIARLQVVHTVGPAGPDALVRHHDRHGSHGTDQTATSYRQVIQTAGMASRHHRALLAVGLDLAAARRPIRQAGGGLDGAARVSLRPSRVG